MFSNGNRREACCAYSSCVYWHASERASFLTDSCDAATGLLKLSRSFRIGRILQRVVVKEERSSSDESLPPPSSLFLSLSHTLPLSFCDLWICAIVEIIYRFSRDINTLLIHRYIDRDSAREKMIHGIDCESMSTMRYKSN